LKLCPAQKIPIQKIYKERFPLAGQKFEKYYEPFWF